ncbi:TIGR01459 family HAD-type hydrolase [Pelagibius sp.]|uniref:TIGR01459 family HAD-type hydrolase n=1 Tax=Pelagibius sp. TaxID=1931238 RepID=UPI002607666B|nr:TIGR01459 family HAD-type hydrolase [Pelagibius sp.]
MTSPELLDGLGAAAARFDAFVLDQYGVLHDGTMLYPGVLDCLHALRDAGKRVLILSNSGKLKQPNVDRLAGLGLPPALYDDFITSGEATRAYLGNGADPALRRRQQDGPLRCLILGGAAEEALLEGLPVTIVSAIEEADFMLLASFGEAAPSTLDAFSGILEQAGALNLALVCANPDVRGITVDGLRPAPGALARRYEETGGTVIYVGKPHPLIYRTVRQALAPMQAGRMLAVGDSLAHDIVGAAGAGMASALILQGIHKDELGLPGKDGDFDDRLAALSARYRAKPDIVLRSLTW